MYCASTDVAVLLPGLWRNGTVTSTVISTIDNLGTGVMGYINGYCARRYAVPFGGGTSSGAIPPTIRDIAEQLGAYRTMRGYFSKDSVNDNAWVDKFKTDADSILKDIRDGKVDLFNTAGSVLAELNASSKVDSNTIDYKASFNEATSTSWEVDPSKLESLLYWPG